MFVQSWAVDRVDEMKDEWSGAHNYAVMLCSVAAWSVGMNGVNLQLPMRVVDRRRFL